MWAMVPTLLSLLSLSSLTLPPQGAQHPGLPVDYAGIISHHEAIELLALRKEAATHGRVSLDLSSTPDKAEVVLGDDGVYLGGGADGAGEPIASYKDLERIVKKAKKNQQGCYQLFTDGSSPCKVSVLSGNTQRPASLLPPKHGGGAPTMVLGGFSMHRVSGGDQKAIMDPMLDTNNKMRALGFKGGGRILDTCCGLGYTAIAARRLPGVTGVTTIELDDASIEMCAANPWSWPLFDEAGGIEVRRGDACGVVAGMEDGSFSGIIHDPPALALCKDTDLYGVDFYRDLRRVLRRGGRLFHYIGNPDSKESGRLYRGIGGRLKDAGFTRVKVDKDAFGIVAE